MTLYTVGHSNHPLDDFLKILSAWSIEHVVDVRRFPSSRRHPQFNRPSLSAALEDRGIGYTHLESLGGKRSPKADSSNRAWQNSGFRGYADYMESGAFNEGIRHLLSIGRECPTAIMCAEALWWSCHRSLIADHLKVRGHTVYHFLSPSRRQLHPYTSAARIVEGELSYVPESSEQEFDW